MIELIEKSIEQMPDESFARERIKGSPLKTPPSQQETPLFPRSENETFNQCSVPNFPLSLSNPPSVES